MNVMERNAIDALVDYQGSDIVVARSKQMNVWCLREVKKQLHREIEQAVSAAKDLLLNEVSNK